MFVVEEGSVTLTDAARAVENLSEMTGKGGAVADQHAVAAGEGETDQVVVDVPPPPRHDNWFEFNDNSVSPIHRAAVEGTYGGSSCAYMLFYARRGILAGLHAPALPMHVQAAIDKANSTLMQQRAEYDEELHRIDVNMVCPAGYTWDGCALRPVITGATLGDAGGAFQLSVDQRMSVAEFHGLVVAHLASLGDVAPEEMSQLHHLREVFPGVWYPGMALLAETTDATPASDTSASTPATAVDAADTVAIAIADPMKRSLVAAGVQHHGTVLVWNGATISGNDLRFGEEHEPININCTQLADAEDVETVDGGADVKTAVESAAADTAGVTAPEDKSSSTASTDFTLFLSRSSTLRQLRQRVSEISGISLECLLLHRMDRAPKQAWGTVGKPAPEVIPVTENYQTLAALGFARGIKVTVEAKRVSGVARATQMAEQISRSIVVTVHNSISAGDDGGPAILRPSVDPATTIAAFKVLLLAKLQTSAPALRADNVRLRVVTDDTATSGLARLLVDESKTLSASSIGCDSELVLECGNLPSAGDGGLVLRFGLGLKARGEMESAMAASLSQEMAAKSSPTGELCAM